MYNFICGSFTISINATVPSRSLSYVFVECKRKDLELVNKNKKIQHEILE